jgi:hypothetical protein
MSCSFSFSFDRALLALTMTTMARHQHMRPSCEPTHVTSLSYRALRFAIAAGEGKRGTSTEHDATVTHHILATGCFLNELTSSLV